MGRRKVLLRRIRVLLALFIVGLVLSGLTAFPIEWGLDLIVTRILGVPADASPEAYAGLHHWLVTVRNGIVDMYGKYPWIAYGTDWLAFAHIVLGILFLGPLRDPVRNLWVIHFGMIACIGVVPLALICGPIRGIPFYWRLIDCSFGVFGIVPLWLVRRWTLELAVLRAQRAKARSMPVSHEEKGGLTMSGSEIKPIAFLLGSGISVPAGMPSTADITERVLSGKGVLRHPGEQYCLGPPRQPAQVFPEKHVPRVLFVVGWLKEQIDTYYARESGRDTNYEDLYYLADQVYQSLDFDNPAIQPFLERFSRAASRRYAEAKDEEAEDWNPGELAKQTTFYISDIVSWMLGKAPSPVDHLTCMKQACEDDGFSRLDFFTLNHDTLMETWLQRWGVEFTDGFRPPVNAVRWWSPALFDDAQVKVRLFKLHGSLNWFGWSNRLVGISVGPPAWTVDDPYGQQVFRADRARPLILVGTFNKMFRYITSVYAELHHHFRRSLRQTDRLVVCGYGFGDRGINSQIHEWLVSSKSNRLVVIHKHPEELLSNARVEIQMNWQDFVHRGMLVWIPKWVQEVRWDDIKAKLSTG